MIERYLSKAFSLSFIPLGYALITLTLISTVSFLFSLIFYQSHILVFRIEGPVTTTREIRCGVCRIVHRLDNYLFYETKVIQEDLITIYSPLNRVY